MSVVLRCPSCGTTRTTPGECQACGEAQARYFCTNHEAGIWLDSTECPQCGARFGEIAPHKTEPALRTTLPPPRKPPRSQPTPFVVPRRPSPIPDEPESAMTPAWQVLLASVLRARSLAAEHDARRSGPGIGGCLRRLLLLAFVLFVVGMVASFFFGRALLHGLQLN